ncbi:MAG: nuclear transport factor 2 family protein [Solirubrobacterales bacterium]
MASTASTDAAVVARAYFEAVARRDLDAMEAFYEPGGTGEIHGLVSLTVPGTYSAWFGDLFRAFPDLRMEILDVVGDGEVAAVRWRATGTFNGDAKFEGLEPNGSRVTMGGCDVLRIRDGRIHRNDAYTNGADLARQLGALPPQGSLPERAMTAALNLKTRLAKRRAR